LQRSLVGTTALKETYDHSRRWVSKEGNSQSVWWLFARTSDQGLSSCRAPHKYSNLEPLTEEKEHRSRGERETGRSHSSTKGLGRVWRSAEHLTGRKKGNRRAAR